MSNLPAFQRYASDILAGENFKLASPPPSAGSFTA